MSRRVFVEEIQGDQIRIEDAEAHHLLHVLRMTTGSMIELFDGQGRLAQARIQQTSRRYVDVAVVSTSSAPASQMPRLTVAAAPAKADRLRWMIEKLTELGVHELILLETDRTIVSPGETKLDKLRTTVINACKQSLRPRLMQLRGLTRLPTLLEEIAASSPARAVYLAHPMDPQLAVAQPRESAEPVSRTGTNHSATPESIPVRSFHEAVLLIGPEGGFTDAEVQSILQLRSPAALVLHWPESILRVETAAVTFAALLLQPSTPHIVNACGNAPGTARQESADALDH